jgi:integrase/recombinase XerC
LKIDEALSLFAGYQYSQNRSVLTVAAYQTDLVQFFRFAACELGQEFETLTLDPIDVYIVRGFLGVLAEYGLTRKSMARKLAALRSFFKFLCRKEILQINPSSG